MRWPKAALLGAQCRSRPPGQRARPMRRSGLREAARWPRGSNKRMPGSPGRSACRAPAERALRGAVGARAQADAPFDSGDAAVLAPPAGCCRCYGGFSEGRGLTPGHARYRLPQVQDAHCRRARAASAEPWLARSGPAPPAIARRQAAGRRPHRLATIGPASGRLAAAAARRSQATGAGDGRASARLDTISASSAAQEPAHRLAACPAQCCAGAAGSPVADAYIRRRTRRNEPRPLSADGTGRTISGFGPAKARPDAGAARARKSCYGAGRVAFDPIALWPDRILETRAAGPAWSPAWRAATSNSASSSSPAPRSESPLSRPDVMSSVGAKVNRSTTAVRRKMRPLRLIWR